MSFGTPADGGAPVNTIVDPGFVCLSCLKVFDRNDLLNRHKRRCKTINRTSKRKACSACVRTKSRCCFTHPSCQRCTKRGEHCKYPSYSSTSDQHVPLDQPVSQPTAATASTDVVLPDAALLNLAMDPLSDLDWVWSLDMVDQLPHPQLNELLAQNASPSHRVTPLNTSMESTTFAPSNNQHSGVLDRPGLEAVSASTSSDIRIGMEHRNGIFMNHSLPDQHHMASYPYASLGRSIPQSTDARPTGVNGLALMEAYSSPSNAGQESIPENVAHSSPQESSLTAPSTEDLADRISPSRDYPSDQESDDDSSLLSSSLILTSTPSPSIGTAAQQVSNTKDLLSIVNNYSRLLLQDDYRSPFIHHTLYSGSYTDMSVMAKSGMAVCCASAFESASSIKFVSKFIITERERIVHTFHRYSCVEEWDALHAMCIYQIIELLDSRKEKNAESGMKAAELHIPFLLKMTRQFCRNHASANQPDDVLEANWQRWLVAETVRRTVFLVNTINILAGHRNGCPLPYYEPLDDEIVFRMALPAPDILWESRNAESWQATRIRLGWVGRERPTIQGLLMGTNRESGKDIQIGRPGLTNSRQLTNVILSCHVYHHSR